MMPLPSMLAMVRLAGRFAWSSWRAPRAVSTADRLDAIAGLELPVEQSVAIHWNQYQVPYIEARSDRDLAVGLGVVHAHLRLFQIDMMRRIAKGTLSELFGHLALELDRSLRIVGFARPVEEIERALPEATRDWLEGFVDGINAVIAQARGVPPAGWCVTYWRSAGWRRAISPGWSGVVCCRSRRAATGRPSGGAW
jgi:penicillin amidase